MKKISSMAVLAVFAATSAMAVSVVNSRHDMVASGFATGTGGSTEVCIFCHTPHGAQTGVTQAPLWNNTLSANIVDAGIYNSYAVINGVSLKSFTVNEAQINATDARLCLACHDGGVGEPVNQPNSGMMDTSSPITPMDSNALISTDLSNDHPIGMDLGTSPQLADPGIRTIAVIKANFGGVSPFFGSIDDSINIMYCSSCHDVHDNAYVPFLRMDNTGSALCKACHYK